MIIDGVMDSTYSSGLVTITRSDRVTAVLLGASVGSLMALNVAPAPYSLALLIIPVATALWLAFQFLTDPDFRMRILYTLIHPGAWGLAVAAGCASVAYGLILTNGPVRPFTYVELTIGGMCFGLAIVSKVSLAAPDMRRLAVLACGWVILVVVLPAAVLGFLKYAYLLTGQKWSLIHLAPGEMYPWGTSLRQDSNLFALPILIAIILCVGTAVGVRAMRWWAFAVVAGYVTIAFYAGINAASRRFVLLLVLGVLAVVILELWRSKEDRIRRLFRSIFLIVIMILGYPVLDAGVRMTAEQLRNRSSAESGVSLPLSNSHDAQEEDGSNSSAVTDITSSMKLEEGNKKAVNDDAEFSQGRAKVPQEGANVIVSGTSRLDTIVTTDLVDSRLAYWRTGLALLSEGNWIKGQGFSYQREISCQVANKCDSFDYPHNFILSHFLFAGVFGFLASVAIICLILHAALLSLRSPLWRDHVFAVVLIAVIAFSFFSGDTVFGIPALCALPAFRLFPRPCGAADL